MNFDKKLKKYATQLDNPTHYGKIIDILEKADKKNYTFKEFNIYDLEKITRVITDFYDTYSIEDEKKLLNYLNKTWFVVSDKHYILAKTPFLWLAIDILLRSYMLIFFAKIRQLFVFDRLITVENVNNEIRICRGAFSVANYFEMNVNDIEDCLVKVDLH